jgi:hypothetical protein
MLREDGVVPPTGLYERLALAKARLDRLDLYPEPVRIEGVRVAVVPWAFRLPRLRRYQGYTLWKTILLRRHDPTDDLLTHELCHIWQMQERPIAAMLAWLRYAYRDNPFEREAGKPYGRRADAFPSAWPDKTRLRDFLRLVTLSRRGSSEMIAPP